MVGSEPDYACEWDFVFDDGDEPRDPMAAAVQLWNPVRVYLPSVARVIGQFSESRHLALRSLAVDFLMGAELATVTNPASGAARHGLLVLRSTSQGRLLTTGANLIAHDDPRSIYQTLYEGAADVLMQPAQLAAGLASAPDWLQAPSVRVVAVNRVVVTPAHDTTLSIEFEFQRPGPGQPLVLTQERGDARESVPARFGAHTITFDGGQARPDPDVASALARDLRLPEPFVAWPGLSKVFARPGAQTTLPMRRAIQSLRDAANTAMEQVIRFFYADLSAAAARSSGSGSVQARPAIVLDIEGLDEATRIRLWWPGGTPDIDSIAVVIDGKQTEPARPATWTNEDRLMQVQVHGINVDPDALASAALTAGVLRLEFTAEPDASSQR
jgi:hypothetical protein